MGITEEEEEDVDEIEEVEEVDFRVALGAGEFIEEEEGGEEGAAVEGKA